MPCAIFYVCVNLVDFGRQPRNPFHVVRNKHAGAEKALRGRNMHKALWAAGAAMLFAVAPAAAQQKSVKVGFVSTFSGPTAVIGNDMRNAFELALDHMGRKMGGIPVEVIYEDDQQKPEVGKQKTEADRIRQGRLHRRLHLVERAARLGQADRRFQDLPGDRQCRRVAGCGRAVFAILLFDIVDERTESARCCRVHE